MIHGCCSLLFFSVATYINMLLLCYCEVQVQVVQEGVGEGEERQTMRQSKINHHCLSLV